MLSFFFLAPIRLCAFVTVENPLTIICRSGGRDLVLAVSKWNLEKKFMSCSAIQLLFRTSSVVEYLALTTEEIFSQHEMTIVDLFIISTQSVMNLVGFLWK